MPNYTKKLYYFIAFCGFIIYISAFICVSTIFFFLAKYAYSFDYRYYNEHIIHTYMIDGDLFEFNRVLQHYEARIKTPETNNYEPYAKDFYLSEAGSTPRYLSEVDCCCNEEQPKTISNTNFRNDAETAWWLAQSPQDTDGNTEFAIAEHLLNTDINRAKFWMLMSSEKGNNNATEWIKGHPSIQPKIIVRAKQ